jgi:hypothetical protein
MEIWKPKPPETFFVTPGMLRDSYYLTLMKFFIQVGVILVRLSVNTQIANFMKIRPVGGQLLHGEGQKNKQADRRTDRHDEAKRRFS